MDVRIATYLRDAELSATEMRTYFIILRSTIPAHQCLVHSELLNELELQRPIELGSILECLRPPDQGPLHSSNKRQEDRSSYTLFELVRAAEPSYVQTTIPRRVLVETRTTVI